MSDRYGPPPSDDPKRFAGLTQRRLERGLPVGRIERPAPTIQRPKEKR